MAQGFMGVEVGFEGCKRPRGSGREASCSMSRSRPQATLNPKP